MWNKMKLVWHSIFLTSFEWSSYLLSSSLCSFRACCWLVGFSLGSTLTWLSEVVLMPLPASPDRKLSNWLNLIWKKNVKHIYLFYSNYLFFLFVQEKKILLLIYLIGRVFSHLVVTCTKGVVWCSDSLIPDFH